MHEPRCPKEEKKSGLFGTGGVGFTFGTRQQSSAAQNTGTSAAASTVGSTQGNVTIDAGVAYRQTGSDVLAPQGDIGIEAQKIDITEARNANRSSTETKFKQSGLTIALTSPVISAVQTAKQMKDAAGQTRDTRMQALAAGSAALAAKNAYDAVQANPGQAGGINLSLSLGSSQSQSNSVQTSSSAQGSTVAAGGNVMLSASGAGKDSDITVQGSTVQTGNDAALKADDDINLLAAKNTFEQHSTNKSSSASIGVSIGTNTGVTLSASQGRGNADGSDVTWSHTRVEAGNKLTLASGALRQAQDGSGDLNIKGAVAGGQQVTADVGGNLNIESLQDTSQYDSKQQSLGGSLTIGAGVSGSISAGKSKVNSSFASVTEQSGIQAGDGGFQVDVQGNTDLKGAVITSTDQAVLDNKNTLTTATLTTSDIENRAEVNANSSGINLSSDMLNQGKYGLSKALVGTALNNGQASGSSAGATRSAVQAAKVTIADDAAQQALTGKAAEQTVASLNRDAANAHSAAQKQDVQAMERTAQAEQAIKQKAFKELTVHTDAAYKAMFKADTKFYKVTCSSTPNECLNDPKLVHMEEITRDEAKRDGQVLAVNGILNDATRAGQLAYQNVPEDKDTGQKPASITLMHIAPADTGLGELFVAGYEKLLAPVLGYTIADFSYADLLQGRGDELTLSLGHSRGTIVQRNAFNIAVDNGYENKNLKVEAVGGGAGVQDYTNAAARITTETGKKDITYTYMANDPVPVIAAGNPGDALAAFKEFFSVLSSNNSAHSCYGTGVAGCTTIANPVPGGPAPTNQNPGLIRVYKGGELMTPQPAISGGLP